MVMAVVMMWPEVNGRWEGVEEQKILYVTGKVFGQLAYTIV